MLSRMGHRRFLMWEGRIIRFYGYANICNMGMLAIILGRTDPIQWSGTCGFSRIETVYHWYTTTCLVATKAIWKPSPMKNHPIKDSHRFAPPLWKLQRRH